ncbi:MAG: ferritin [bacterium]
MISNAMQQAINDQINKEIYSAYVYLSFAAQSAGAGLKGLSNWFRRQYEEELGHGMRLFQYMLDRNAEVRLKAIQEPPRDFPAPLAVFERVLKHEQDVTRSINRLMDLAVKEKDHASHNVLEWFVSEQVEEEANVQEIIDRLRLIGKDGSGLIMLDMELGKRSGEKKEEEA